MLTAWAELRAKNKNAPHLLTFDFHTDTLKAFNAYAYKKLKLDLQREPERQEHEAKCARLSAQIDFRKPASVQEALRFLRHDEHIDAARRAGIVGKIAVILSTREPGNTPEFADVFLPAALNEPEISRQVLESETLRPTLSAIEKSWGATLAEAFYIADIDLDFFRSEKAITPKDASAFKEILQHAALITVARESKCVLGLRLPGEKITADSLLARLRQFVGT